MKVKQKRKGGEKMPIAICRACKSYAGKAINYITDENKAERHIRGGQATKMKYSHLPNEKKK